MLLWLYMYVRSWLSSPSMHVYECCHTSLLWCIISFKFMWTSVLLFVVYFFHVNGWYFTWLFSRIMFHIYMNDYFNLHGNIFYQVMGHISPGCFCVVCFMHVYFDTSVTVYTMWVICITSGCGHVLHVVICTCPLWYPVL